jgi:hypothetical protein
MIKSYYVKKPGGMLWGDCYTLHELKIAVASGQVGRDWVASSDTVSGEKLTVDELVSQPDPVSVPAPKPVSVFTLPPVEKSGVALALSIIAVLEFIAAPIAGIVVGSDAAPLGWLVLFSGVISGLIFLGFARVIDHTSESSQRLRRIEMLIQKGYDDKDAA